MTAHHQAPAEALAECPPRATLTLSAAFDRHFALQQVRTDCFGTAVGAAVYLSLVPTLLGLHRPELVAVAVVSALLCVWPTALCRLGRKELYLRCRDYLILAHFCYHYCIGGQLARFIRIHQKLGDGTAPGLLAGFALSSSVVWQAVDALMYRVRVHRFVVFKPIVLLAVLPLELHLCELTCTATPVQGRAFGVAVDVLRLLLAPFRAVPGQVLATAAGPEAPAVSCFKLQIFMLVTLSWLLPAMVLSKLEAQMLAHFAEEHPALAAAEQEAAAPAGTAVPGEARSRTARVCAQLAVLRHRMRQQLSEAKPHTDSSLAEAEAVQGPRWGVPVLLLALVWQLVDMLAS